MKNEIFKIEILSLIFDQCTGISSTLANPSSEILNKISFKEEPPVNGFKKERKSPDLFDIWFDR